MTYSQLLNRIEKLEKENEYLNNKRILGQDSKYPMIRINIFIPIEIRDKARELGVNLSLCARTAIIKEIQSIESGEQ